MFTQRVLLAFTIAFALVPIGLHFYVEAFKIPSGSVTPTIKSGDDIFATKSAYGVFTKGQPRRGDVIVFVSPEAEEPVDYVKRVVGLPGDLIAKPSHGASRSGIEAWGLGFAHSVTILDSR